ncbi:DUF1798 family protein [Jeotgalibacillus sp. R-1-5s-1]|uniref:DUF1798 family protein n=1 Tax=Jeotgalibacillus sp. R-1-5s-1 TaxID=2555897 RepID=UPI00106DA73F|nr:DUF1798 family protein [Jeotgalibacillus sp. R-1-5s-1]TFE03243.1 DUF1798 family protein [Jeotgalibacillus sp. R-1-5s-1]
MKTNEILELTNQLAEILEQADEEYNKRRETKEKGDFHDEVKPFADRAHALISEWKEKTSAQLIKNPQKNIHHNQIFATADNLELVTVQCFFPETSYKRFKSYVQSSRYVLGQVEMALSRHTGSGE